MKIKLDENLPAGLLQNLADIGHDVDTVEREGLAGNTDDDVWQAAPEAGRFLITQDLDFSDIRKFEPGTHCGILLVRLRTPGRMALRARVATLFATCNVSEWDRCFVVATDHKLRVRRAG